MKGTQWVFVFSGIILVFAVITYTCQALLDPESEFSLDLDGPVPQQIAEGHNGYLALLVEKEAELKKAGKLPEFTTIESRFDLMESSAREYFETNSSLSARETEQVLEKSREFLTSLARRNNKLLEKKISQLKSNSGNSVDPEEEPVITGEEFIHNILAVKLEMGMMNARVYHAVVELMSLQQTSGEPLPTAYFQEYAEKEILSRDWTEEEMQ